MRGPRADIRVTAVTVEAHKTERELRQGIVTDTRRAVQDWASHRFGWATVTTTVERISADGLVTVTAREGSAGR